VVRSLIAALLHFIDEFHLKELLKSVNVWQSYRQKVDCALQSIRALSCWKMNSPEIWHNRPVAVSICCNGITITIIDLNDLVSRIDKCDIIDCFSSHWLLTPSVSDWTSIVCWGVLFCLSSWVPRLLQTVILSLFGLATVNMFSSIEQITPTSPDWYFHAFAASLDRTMSAKAFHVFRLTVRRVRPFVRPFVRSPDRSCYTTICHERLEQSWWNVQEYSVATCWLPIWILKIRGQRSRSQRPTAHAPGGRSASPPAGSVTDDDRRRQTTDVSEQNNTDPGPLGGPVVIRDHCNFLRRTTRSFSPKLWRHSVLFWQRHTHVAIGEESGCLLRNRPTCKPITWVWSHADQPWWRWFVCMTTWQRWRHYCVRTTQSRNYRSTQRNANYYRSWLRRKQGPTTARRKALRRCRTCMLKYPANGQKIIITGSAIALHCCKAHF